MPSSLSPDRKLFALVTPDNRLKVWDTKSLKLVHQCVESGHLSSQYTSISWMTCSSSTTTTPKKKQRNSKSPLSIALGTSKGEIVVWSLAKEEVSFKLKGHSSSVNDLAYQAETDCLFSCSDDNYIIQWDMKTKKQVQKVEGDKKGVKKMALRGDRLASASTSIKLWDVASLTVSKKFQGHSTGVSSLEFSPDGKYLASASGASDRFVNLWACGGEETTSSRQDAIQSFTCNSSISMLRFNKKRKQESTKDKGKRRKVQPGETYDLVAVTEGKGVLLWQFKPKEAAKGPKKPKGPACTFLCSKSGPQALYAEFDSSSSLLLVRGSLLKPSFSVVNFLNDFGEPFPEFTLPEIQTSNLLSADVDGKVLKENVNQATVLNAGAKASAMSDSTASAPVGQEKATQEASMSLQHKLMRLSKLQNQQQQQHKTTEAPKADSLQTVLQQALHTGDKSLLNSCLAISNPTVVSNTVLRLPAGQILRLLHQLVDKFESKASAGPTLLPWLHSTLKHHSAYLMTVPGLLDTLTRLDQLIESRLVVFQKLLTLSGKLDLILAQVQTISEQEERKVKRDPLVLFYDDDGEGPTVERHNPAKQDDDESDFSEEEEDDESDAEMEEDSEDEGEEEDDEDEDEDEEDDDEEEDDDDDE